MNGGDGSDRGGDANADTGPAGGAHEGFIFGNEHESDKVTATEGAPSADAASDSPGNVGGLTDDRTVVMTVGIALIVLVVATIIIGRLLVGGVPAGILGGASSSGPAPDANGAAGTTTPDLPTTTTNGPGRVVDDPSDETRDADGGNNSIGGNATTRREPSRSDRPRSVATVTSTPTTATAAAEMTVTATSRSGEEPGTGSVEVTSSMTDVQTESTTQTPTLFQSPSPTPTQTGTPPPSPDTTALADSQSPSVEAFAVTDRSTDDGDPTVVLEVSWRVADANSDLEEVRVRLRGDGSEQRLLDRQLSTVGGETASGTTTFTIDASLGSAYDIALVVGDQAGNSVLRVQREVANGENDSA